MTVASHGMLMELFFKKLLPDSPLSMLLEVLSNLRSYLPRGFIGFLIPEECSTPLCKTDRNRHLFQSGHLFLRLTNEQQTTNQ